jgi:hypothetical protein
MIEDVAGAVGEYGAHSTRGLHGARVPYVPGHPAHRVANEDQTIRIPRAGTRNRSRSVMAPRWGAHGTLAVVTVLGFSLIADAAVLFFIAWWQR